MEGQIVEGREGGTDRVTLTHANATGQTGSLDPVDAGSVAKSYNVKLQLADASESSGPPKELDPKDVPAWRTKMCENRMSVLLMEKRKLRSRSLARSLACVHAPRARLGWRCC